MGRVIKWHYLLSFFLLTIACVQSGNAEVVLPSECHNLERVRALRILENAVNFISGRSGRVFEVDSTIDKSLLLNVLRDPHSIHLFYPSGARKIDQAFDWESIKKNQVESIGYFERPDDVAVYVLGMAPTSSSLDIELAQDRVREAVEFIKNTLRLRVGSFRGAW